MQIQATALSAGLSAIQTGQEQLASAAQAIAQHSSPQTMDASVALAMDMTEQLLMLEHAKVMNELGARVIATAEQSLGTLIDIQA
ncbi:MAG: hypothetical protein GX908_09550 [Gammaproteobacteria bacterium]|nr:hypothetical protein [Gammaproteobacteria bacterium]